MFILINYNILIIKLYSCIPVNNKAAKPSIEPVYGIALALGLTFYPLVRFSSS